MTTLHPFEEKEKMNEVKLPYSRIIYLSLEILRGLLKNTSGVIIGLTKSSASCEKPFLDDLLKYIGFNYSFIVTVEYIIALIPR